MKTWAEVDLHLKSLIAEEQARLETDLDATSTTRCRARIRAFKDVLDWADAAPMTIEPEIFHE